MKNWLVIMIGITLVVNVALISMTLQYKNSIESPNYQVYTFEGKTKNLELHNGVITCSPDKNLFNGGNVSYLGETEKNIKSYTQTIYLALEKNEKTILANSVTNEVDNEGLVISKEAFSDTIGYSTSTNLKTYGSIDELSDKLYYSLEGERKDGSKFHYDMKLTVKEIDNEKNK